MNFAKEILKRLTAFLVVFTGSVQLGIIAQKTLEGYGHYGFGQLSFCVVLFLSLHYTSNQFNFKRL